MANHNMIPRIGLLFLILISFSGISSQSIFEPHPQLDTLKQLAYLEELIAYDKSGQYQKYYSRTMELHDSINPIIGEQHPFNIDLVQQQSWASYRIGNIEDSDSFGRKAIYLRETFDSLQYLKIAQSYSMHSAPLSYLGLKEETYTASRRALAICRKHMKRRPIEQARLFTSIATNYRAFYDLDSAIVLYKEASDTLQNKKLKKNEAIEGTLTTNLAATYSSKGNYTLALKTYRSAFNIMREKLGYEHPLTASSIGGIGSCLAMVGKPMEAIEYLEEADRIITEAVGNNSRSGKGYRTNLAIAYSRIGEDDKAIKILEEDIKEIIKTHGPNNRNLFHPYINLVGNYNKVLDLEKEKEVCDKLMALTTKNHGRSSTQYAISIISLSDHFENRSQYDSIIIYAKIAAEIFSTNAQGKESGDLADIEYSIAEAYFNLGKYDQALIHINKGKEALLYKTVEDLPFISNVNQLFYHILLEFDVLELMKNSKSSLEHLTDLKKINNEALKIFEHLLLSYQNPKTLLALAEKYRLVFDRGVETNIKLYQATQKNDFLFEALAIADKSKSRLSVDKFKANDLDKFSHVDQDLVTAFQTAKQNLSYYATEIKYQDSIGEIKMKERIILEQENLLKITTQINSSHTKLSSYLNLKDFDYKKLLKQDHQIIYFQQIDSLYHIFFIDQEIQYTSINSNSKLLPKIAPSKYTTEDWMNLKKLVQNKFDAKFSNSALDKELLIIPDGIFATIPFDIIYCKDEQEISDQNISYDRSILMHQLNESEKNKTKKELAIFAGNYNNNSLAEVQQVRQGNLLLPGAISESKDILNIIDGDFFTEENTNEHMFKTKATNYKVLHLAMHAIQNNNDSNKSQLIFADIPTDTLEDNILYTEEIYSLNLNCELAVLSACETGLGENKFGEGVFSLGQSFRYAGAKSILMSLWKVPDQSTAYLMVEFYKNLKQGLRKDEALRNAKLTYLNDDNIPESQKTPYHWAGFIASGNMAPISFSSPNYVLIISGLILLAFLIYFLKTKIT